MVIKTLLVITITPLIFLLFLAYAPGLLDITPTYVSSTPPRPIQELKPSWELENTVHLLTNFLEGPESIEVYKGDLYTGISNGWIVKIQNETHLTPIARISNSECDVWNPCKCGRPLGLRFDDNGVLYVADACYGVYSINVTTGATTIVYNSSHPVDGKSPEGVDDLDINTLTGDLYFSDISSKFDFITEGMYEVLEGAPNGRILHHNLATKVTRTLVKDLVFANGVQLSPDKKFLLFCESFRGRVMKYHLSGKSKGKLEVFIDNLPGAPDNIRPNGQGGYWIAICSVDIHHTDLLTKLHTYPVIRRALARLLHILDCTLSFVSKLLSSTTLKTLQVKVTDMGTYASMVSTPYGLVIEVNSAGKIIRSLHAPQGSTSLISQVSQVGNVLYLGSPWNNYVGKLTLTAK